MLPTEAEFAAKLGALGLGDEHRIILYDAGGILGAARVWWSLRAFGHTNAAILDGGLKSWHAAGLPVTREIPSPAPARFTARFDPSRIRDSAQLLANIDSRSEQVLDARAASRFEGAAAEPWPGRRSGHIPGSLNLDHTRLVGPTGTVKPAETLVSLFAEAGIDPARPVVTSCGSGITASVLAFGLHLVGHDDVAVYDGSWAEWGLPGPLPVETGPPRLTK
jgi:thiosulfate/3-mercaptopyruvate sulfurtransferase